MSAETKLDLEPEIAHILLIDVVGYSKLLVNEQIELLQELNQIVRGSAAFRAAEAEKKLLRLPTGDAPGLSRLVVPLMVSTLYQMIDGKPDQSRNNQGPAHDGSDHHSRSKMYVWRAAIMSKAGLRA